MYLDPAFGGMLIQLLVLVAAVAGGLVFSFRRKIRSLFSKGNKRKGPGEILSKNDQESNSDDGMIDMIEGSSKEE